MKMQKSYFLSFLLMTIFTPTLVLAMPAYINPPGERVVVVSPREHAWGAYNSDGRLVKSGLASAGADWCADVGRPCRTWEGSFRVQKMGGKSCYSPSFPLPNGGAPMPYCMYFNPYQALHGSYNVRHANISHGCVRMRVADAYWLQKNFVGIGTLVVIQSY